MKRVLVALLMTALISIGAMAALDTDDYVGGVYFLNLDQAVLVGVTSTGLFDMIGGARFDNTTLATTLTITETNIALVGVTSFTGASSFFGGTTVIGFDVGAAMTFTTTDATGDLAITHAGTAPDITWTADSFDIVGPIALDAVTATGLDGPVGAVTPAAGTFTDLKGNSLVIDDGGDDLTIDSDNQTDASAAATVPDFTDTTADFLMTNLFTVILPFNGGLAGEDTDAAGTNGGGMVGSTVDVTTHDFNDSGGAADDVLCKVYDFTSTTWDDLSTSATLSAGADWTANYQLLPDADAEEAGDAFAVGFDEQFCEIVFNDLATGTGALATWGGDGAKYQYSTGAATWSDLTVWDATDTTANDGLRSLQQAGAITFAPPSDWVVATYDGEEAYWVKYVITAAQLTQTALIDSTNKDEPIVGIPTTDSFQAPYKMEIVDVRVTDMGDTVHNQNIKFVVGNFTDGVFSAELTWPASQFNDKFALASAIAADPDDIIGIMVTDDGGSTVNPVWAVEFEVTYED